MSLSYLASHIQLSHASFIVTTVVAFARCPLHDPHHDKIPALVGASLLRTASVVLALPDPPLTLCVARNTDVFHSMSLTAHFALHVCLLNVQVIADLYELQCQRPNDNGRTGGSKVEFASKIALTVPFEFHRRDIKLGAVIGSGQFGKVYAGHFSPATGRMKTITPVALKVIHGQEGAETSAVAVAAFMEEAAVGWQFVHENVVRTFGVVTSGPPFLLVLELCERGVLREYVRTADRDVSELLCILRDVAVGMAYVHTMGVVNVLLDKKGVPKIADFGLGRKVKSGDEYYRASNATHLPLRWMDPWSIQHSVFNFGTDVWSFGILAIEMFTRGARPYNHWPSNLVVLEHVRGGYRLPCPPTMPKMVHDRVVLPSWSSSASTNRVRSSAAGETNGESQTASTAATSLSVRPSFANLVSYLDEIIAENDDAIGSGGFHVPLSISVTMRTYPPNSECTTASRTKRMVFS